jgi:hypothetical protein
VIDDLFAAMGAYMDPSLAFFPPELRNPIMDAGSSKTLLRFTYDGIQREVEPYCLAYKRRKDGVAQEYFYAWDRSGGSSGVPGIRQFLNPKISNLQPTEEQFTPRFPIELAKAGEQIGDGYFSRQSTSRRAGRPSVRRSLQRVASSGPVYVVECIYCSKKFRRKRSGTTLRPHKDPSGWACPGRRGYLVDTIY